MGERPRQLRDLLARPAMVVIPGATDALTARLAQEVGFPAVYATGAGIANSLLGLPDVGLTTMTEIVDQVRRMVDAVTLPIIADADTGWGNPLNVIRTVGEFERAGVAGLQLEDQVSPKRCGHFAGKEVIPAGEMVQKLRAAATARDNPDLVLIARTDSLATHGIEEAIARGRAYAAAGADLIFVEAPTTREQLALLPRAVPAPLVVNMTEGGVTPLLDAGELAALGYKVVLYPNTALRVAMQAVREALARLREDGSSRALLERLVGWQERQRIVRLPEIEALERAFARPHEGADPPPA